MEVIKLAEKIKKLDTNNRFYLLREIMKDEDVSVTELLVAKIADLEDFKDKARRDIPKIAEAGLELGEEEMRSITGIGGRARKKDDSFKLAMVRCLLDAGAFKGSQYGDEIATTDFSSIDDSWYDRSWKPQTTLKQEKN